MEDASDLPEREMSTAASMSKLTEVSSPTPPTVNPVAEAFGLPKKPGTRMTEWPKMTEMPSSTHNAPTGTNFHEALRKSKTNNDAECYTPTISISVRIKISI